jgi:hypothetical protein
MSVDRYCFDSFEALFQRLKDEGRIAPRIDIPTLAKVFSVLGDGMFWRRVIEPQANMRAVLPVVIEMVGALLNPVEKTGLPEKVAAAEARR